RRAVRARRAAPRPSGRERGLLRRRRSARQRGQACPRPAGRHRDHPPRRDDRARGPRRRAGRGRPRGCRPTRPAPPRGGDRRKPGGDQPARRPDYDPRRAAMRVIIAEDLVLLRDGLTRLLRDNDIEVVAAVNDGEALVREVAALRPDLAIVDIRLPPSFHDEGLRAALEARRRVPGTAVLVVSQYVEHTYAQELLADGRGGV